jgi:cysteinyl-tRNA synthetase
MHNGYINIDNRKMSKSLGNFFTVREAAAKYGYEPIKFMMLSAHYRSPLSYSTEVLEQCRAALERMRTCRENLDFAKTSADSSKAEPSSEFLASLDARRLQFEAAMDDDLNTADAIAALFDLVRDCNIHFAAPKSERDVDAAIKLFDTLCDVLGILYSKREPSDLDTQIQALIDERAEARKSRDFARADAIRDTLLEKGIQLKDTPEGVRWSFVNES